MVDANAPKSIADVRNSLREKGPSGFARHLLGRIDATAQFGALVEVDRTGLDAAMHAASTHIGPLAGVAVCVKDNIDALGFQTRCASPALKGNEPASDATVVARLRSAGAVIFAKTNMHELSFGVTSNNAATGPVRNPFDPDRTAGGSSGGSGAAVALGLAPFALGSDTGGSVRIPAAFCGLYGFRPTTGRYPATGVMCLSSTRDTVGNLASDLGDIRMVDHVLADMPARTRSVRPPGPLRLGVFPDAGGGLCRKVDAVVSAALDRLRASGITLVTLDPTDFADLDERFGEAIVFVEAERTWRDIARARGRDLAGFTADIASADVREVFHALPDLAKAHRVAVRHAREVERPALRRKMARIVAANDLDGWIGATVPVQPPRIGEDAEMQVEGQRRPVFRTLTRNLAIASVLGMPSITIPAGRDADGLPVGLQIEFLPDRDEALLDTAGVVDDALRDQGGSRPA